MSVLRAGVDQVFIPVLPAMGAGIVWVFFVAWQFGRSERRRLAATPPLVPDTPPQAIVPQDPASPTVFYFNAALTTLVIFLLLQGLFPASFGLPEVPAPLVFMVAFALALPVNRRTARAERDQIASHAASAVLVVSMILAAGVFTGILSGSGMLKAMAAVVASNIPSAVTPWLNPIVALASMPLSLVFTPDAFYFGVLPVFADVTSALGRDPVTIGRAAILGQMTTGFPLSPLTASTFILVGLSGVSLREHQRYVFKWALGTTVVMTIVASLTGAI
jgi:CitMHS family citrate-Mg2+:H+ or citrate-Ca2+:H+ symporter